MSLRWTTFTLALALACLAAGTWTAYRAGGWLLDAATPALAWVAACAVGAGRRYRATEQRQRWLRTALNRYISPNRVAHLVAHPDLLHLGGQRQVCSFVFTDLVGFTSLLESTEPEQAVARMNEYLDGMLEVVFRHEGTLDRIVGDAIAVLFSAPVPQADHRRRALACAMDLHAFASQFAAGLRSQGLPWGDTRIGVHSGEVIVGNFGGQRLFDYRALGDPVNTASRLEGANRHVGTLVLVSQAVLQDCPDTPVRPVGRLLLKGKHEPVTVATPEATLPAGSAPLADYLAAWALLQGPGADPPAARAAFGRLAGSHPADALIQMHARRLADGAADDLIALAEK